MSKSVGISKLPDGKKVDYSLYLVTDSTPAILGDKDIVEVVEAALQGGVTIVQYRDKTSDTADLISTGKKLHAITQKYGVPLLINDRLDVAIAVGCQGVHIGQDDIDLSTAREILGPDAIIGVTASSIPEALAACQNGANYLGIGTMFATPTKTNTKGIIGTAGTKEILGAIAEHGYADSVSTVSIGGINPSTIQRVLYQSAHPLKPLSGVAIVSAIISAPSPKTAASQLLHLLHTPPPFTTTSLTHPPKPTSPKPTSPKPTSPETLLSQIPTIILAVNRTTPLSHNITNLVVQNLAANVALAIGGSPIMSNSGAEASDLALLGGSLVLNMGSITPEGLQNSIQALRAYNLCGGPVVLDPVGAGATAVRRDAVRTLLASGYFDVIKGNEGEIKTVFAVGTGARNSTGKEEVQQQRGVDSGPSTLSPSQKAQLVRALALRERNIVLMTGATDFLSDGQRTFAVENGHELLGRITGSGCVLGTAISCMLAVSREDKLLGALAGLLHFEIAAEVAAQREDVRGPGTFVPALIDELWGVGRRTVEGDLRWLERARVRCVDVED
ncbi:hypothetical protein EG329_003820 [Mollisiaceae sp. DMI_Dod_QoI]|nr:hypothetical protein EG329_003820 [Helotiales sp. DMI_Dod_QoI]